MKTHNRSGRKRFTRLLAALSVVTLIAACGSDASDDGADSGAAASDTEDEEATAAADGDDDSTSSEDDAAALSATYEGPEVSLDFWNGFTGGDGPFMQALVDEFNAEHDNITVNMEVQAWGEYYEAVPAAVGTGRGPHLGVMHVDQLATNAARNVLSPVDDFVDVLELDGEDFSPPVWEAGVFRDQRFGIPLDVHPVGFYYNRTLMEEAGLDPDSPPQDRESYDAALDAFKAAGIQGHWVSPYAPGARIFESVARQFGAELYSPDGREATWNSPEGVAALEWMLGLIEDGHSPSDVGDPAEAIAFQNGENGFYWGGIWMINTFGEEEDLDWDVAPLPVIGDEAAVWAGSHNLVVMERQDEDPNERQAALVFLDWILDQSIGWAEGGQVPAAEQVRNSDALQELPFIPTFASQLGDTFFPPSLPGIGDAQGHLWAAINEVILSGADPQGALDDAARAANEALEQSREQFGE